MGLAHMSRGEHARAEKCFLRASELEPRFAPALSNLGISQAELGRYEDAIASYRRAIVAKPDYPEAHFNLGNAYFRSGQYREAASSFEQALVHRPQFPDAVRGLAMAHLEAGNATRAAELFQTLLASDPSDLQALSGLGSAEDRLGNHEQAVELFIKALELEPSNADAANNLGNAQMNLNRVDEAAELFRQAIALRPDDAMLHANYFGLLERTNKIGELADALAAATEACARGSTLLDYWSGVLADRQGSHEDAYRILESVVSADLPPKVQQSLAERLAKLADRLGDTAAAWAHCHMMNELATTQQLSGVDGSAYIAEVQHLIEAWDRSPPCLDDDAEEGSDLIFMVGFPRSGTTLLDSVLRGHPLVNIVEEKPLVEQMRALLDAAATPNVLATLRSEEIAKLRAAYRSALAQQEQKPGSTVTIDKMPLNLIHAGLIHHVFPGARFLLVLRHPCDCVLSCLFQNFRLNDSMANFTTLDGAARLYDATMRLWLKYEKMLPLRFSTVRYEDLIADLEGTAQQMLGELGLPWDDRVLDYQATARGRSRIRTPSYSQVTENLYSHATGRWTRYREHLSPILPQLEPWTKRWEYS
ncbi:MAG: sulfotransferase [Pseudomonadota bacterium]